MDAKSSFEHEASPMDEAITMGITARWVGKLTHLSLIRPVWTLIIGIAASLACGGLAASVLQFKTSRLDLLDPSSDYNRRWLSYLEQFGRRDDAIVLIDGKHLPQAEHASVAVALRQLGKRLEEEPLFESVLYHRKLGEIANKSIYWVPPSEQELFIGYLASTMNRWRPVATGSPTSTQLPDARFEGAPREVELPIFRSETSETAPRNSNLAMQWQYSTPLPLLALTGQIPKEIAEQTPVELQTADTNLLVDDIESLTRFLADPTQPPLLGAQKPIADYLAALPSNEPQADNSDLLLEDQGTLGLCMIPLLHPDDQPKDSATEISRLKYHVEAIRALFPNLKFQITGMPILEADEGSSTQNDMLIASVISLIGVAIVFIWGIGSIRLPLLSLSTLIIALGWTIGFATLAIGHLNLLSAAFGAILLGLGIDYSIHFVSHFTAGYRFSSAKDRKEDLKEQLQRTAEHCGPGIWVGGLTTAVAFGCASFTPFRGVAELGIISAGGTLLCVLSSLTVLPAVLFLTYCSRIPDEAPSADAPHFAMESKLLQAAQKPIGDLVEAISYYAIRFPIPFLMIAVVAVCLLAAPAARIQFDHNLLNLQADDLESVQAEYTLMERNSRGVWYAVSLATSAEEAIEKGNRFLQLPTVGSIDHAGAMFPSSTMEISTAKRLQAIRDLAISLKSLASQAPPTSTLLQLEQTLEQLKNLIEATGSTTAMQRLHSATEQCLQQLRQTDPKTIDQRLLQFETAKRNTLAYLAQQLEIKASQSPPQVTDLSQAIRSRSISPNGLFQIRIFPKDDVWDRQPLEMFVKQLEQVDPQVTGHPVQTYYASGELQESYFNAAIYALIAITLILWVDTRSLRMTLLALIPSVLAILFLLGAMHLLGMPLNPANMIALPLVLGIGIDDGIHLVQDYGHQRGHYKVHRSTAVAVLLTSVTTMVGFGSLMISEHLGLYSLGWVLTVGIGLCWLNSVVVLPGLLSLLRRHERREMRRNLLRRPRGLWSDNLSTDAGSYSISPRTAPLRPRRQSSPPPPESPPPESDQPLS